MHTLAILFAAAAVGFFVLLVRPQLALRTGNSVPSRRKLLIPFFACWILAAVMSQAARKSNDSNDPQSSNGGENSSVVRASYASPERKELATKFVEVKKLADLSDHGGLQEDQHPGCTASVIQLVNATGPLSDYIQTRLHVLRRGNVPDPENDPSMSPIYESDAQMLGQLIRNTELVCGM
ncbi:hypothetical protein [Paraburkholderia phytofirmans]|uniref:hypothetical protein n=1 Tax=Paraburkholderia phytofirmans TaxID=261302 RepID=UPI0038BDF9F9